MDSIEFPPVVGQKLERIGLYELFPDVAGLWPFVHADD